MPRSEDIYFFETDTGSHLNPPLVLIHGAGGDFNHWPQKLRRLHGCRVLTPDLPGHGLSTGFGHQSIKGYAQSILDFLNRLGIYKAVFCGHSMGGAITQHIAVYEPERTAGAVLVGTGAALPVNQKLLDYLSVQPTFSKSVQLLAKWSINKSASETLKNKLQSQLASNRQKVLYGDYLACNSFDLRDEIDTIQAPTLVVSASEDKMTIPSYSDFLHQKIRNSTLHLIEDSGHMILWEKPDELTQVIKEFIQNIYQD